MQQDYLLSFRKRKIAKARSAETEPIKKEDIVILKEDGTTRALWKLAKVVETLEGRDGLISAAKVQLLSNDKTVHLRRPLIPLEAKHDSFVCVFSAI